MKPKRIQLRRTKGWKMPENTVNVARPTRFGNMHRIGPCGVCGVEHTREEAIAEFRAELAEMVCGPLDELRGKNLACWCPLGQPCHADVLLEMANA